MSMPGMPGFILEFMHLNRNPSQRQELFLSPPATALNVDQKNTTTPKVGEKNAVSTVSLPGPLSVSTATATTRGINGQDQPASGTMVGGSAVAVHKEARFLKVQADKKKMDARKKSLKRL